MPKGSLPPRDRMDQRAATYNKVLYDPSTSPLQKQKAYKMLYHIDKAKANEFRRSASAKGLKLSGPVTPTKGPPKQSKNIVDRRIKNTVSNRPYKNITPDKMNKALKRKK